MQRERQQVENALDDGVGRCWTTKSVAWWDDAVTNLSGARLNTEWADIEIMLLLNETYGHDEVFVPAQRADLRLCGRGERGAAGRV